MNCHLSARGTPRIRCAGGYVPAAEYELAHSVGALAADASAAVLAEQSA